MRRRLAYGSWPSPVTAEAVASAGLKLGQIAWDGDALCWLEGRPDEGGRSTVVRAGPSATVDRVDAPLDVRSAVHEYGGGAFAVYGDTLYFVNSQDQAVYRRRGDEQAQRLTPTDDRRSFADLQIDAARGRLIAVCEDGAAGAEPRASLVTIGGDGRIETLAEGRDFYASPRLSPQADRLVWLAWDHPNMPWDGTELWAADLNAAGQPAEPRCLAGGVDESLFAPVFDPEGLLHVVSDADGWWNIHRVDTDGLSPVTRETAEFGLPQWVFGQSTYGFDADGALYALFTRDGFWQLARVDRVSGALSVFDLPFTQLQDLRVDRGRLAFIGGSATTPPTLCSMRTDGSDLRRLQPAHELGEVPGWDEAALSTPETLDYPTADGDTAHALYYPPRHPDCEGPEEQRPPLLIKCHGGPTGATGTALDPRIQFWTSRGFAVLDVNYRGSTGYGRDYRRALYGRWGEADVADCVHGARYLIDRGLVDPERVLISGSSAGGYTVLCVLTFTDLAAAGASYYGVADLQRLLASTHKFESRYLGRLIGDDPALLRARSPLYHAEALDCPVLFLQGLKDKVVPPDQAEAMADAARRRGVPVALVTFPEERHGFRSADNIRNALASELAFYARVLGLEPADDLPPLNIDNPA